MIAKSNGQLLVKKKGLLKSLNELFKYK